MDRVIGSAFSELNEGNGGNLIFHRDEGVTSEEVAARTAAA